MNEFDNRIDQKFQELQACGKKALIAFLTAGDPDYNTTEQTVLEMQRQGADLIELGVPFSDPIAEGPVIQAASQRALDAGTTLAGIFDLVRRLRAKTDIPLLLMMYVNMIFRFGKDKFFSLCRECGVDGVIVSDLPYEEREEILHQAQGCGVRLINLVTPTSAERIQAIASNSKGFLYCVSSTGVTGVRSEFTTDFDSFFAAVREHASAPCAVGFGISTPGQVRQMKRYCDGVIVGSAIVRILAEHGRQAVPYVGEFVHSLREALDQP